MSNENKEENKVIPSITLEDLIKELKVKEDYKVTVENEYYKVIGQIQLLSQQINTIKEKLEATKQQ